MSAAEHAPPVKHRCGWPHQLRASSTVVHCGLDFCHDGPLCRLLDADGASVVAWARFEVHRDQAAE